MEKDIQQKSASALREEEILKYWQDERVFEQSVEKNPKGNPFVFYEGPPTANGIPGVHHVETRSFKDVIARYKTMRGFYVRRKAGWDTHGLPVELQVEKELGLKSKKEIESYGVAAFNEKCKESVWKYRTMWEDLTRRMGYWLDMDHAYVTYENPYIESLWQVLKTADQKKLLYKDYKVVPWCTRCGTGLSSHELGQPGAYQDDKDLSVTAKFKLTPGQQVGELIADQKFYIIAWTTTPWTLLGNVALAVGEKIAYGVYRLPETGEHIICAQPLVAKLLKEKPYQEISFIEGSKLVGLTYEPLFPYFKEIAAQKNIDTEKAYKIYGADFVTTEDGTGVVHTAVMYGQDDFELGTNVGLPKMHMVGEDGLYVKGTGEFEGRYVKDEAVAVDVIKSLAHQGLLFSKEKYTHSYPHCWRCNTPLIYYARNSWYIRMSSLRDQMLAGNDAINWEPDHIKAGRFGEWLDGIKDWAISRDRYWGTPLPVWETAEGKNVVIGSLGDLKKHAKKSGNTYFGIRHGEGDHNVNDICSSDKNYPHHLTEKGKADVRQSAEKLKNKNITQIIISPFVRTKETAEIVADVIGFPSDKIIIDERLHEFDFGDFHLKPKKEYYEWRDSVNADFFTKTPGGESLFDAKLRFGGFLYDIESKYSGENILFVTHGIAFEVLPSVVQGQTAAETWAHWRKDRVPYGDIESYDFVPLPHNERYELDFHKPFIDEITLQTEDGEDLKRTAEVMDVWFDSGCMPFAQDSDARGLHPDAAMHNWFDDIAFPADYITEAIDQTRGWFYTLHAVANIMGKPLAYKNVVCLGHILDKDGQKMSKSKGNVVNPWDMFDKYGADTMRLWMYSVTAPGDSKNFDEKTVKELQNKFFNTLENCLQILKMYEEEEEGALQMSSLGSAELASLRQASSHSSTFAKRPEDEVMNKWIESYFAKTHKTVTDSLDAYDMFTASRAIREFVTELSQWYVRRSRDGLKESAQTRAVLRTILKNFAVLIAPFVPFTAEWLFEQTGGEGSVHLQDWIVLDTVNNDVLTAMEEVRSIVSKALEARQKVNIKVRQPLQKLSIAKTNLSSEYFEIVKDEVNVKEVIIDENLEKGTVVLDTAITPELKAEGAARELMRTIQEMRKVADLVPKDQIVAYMTDTQPEWFEKHQSEILKTVGAEKVIWGAAETKVEKI